MAIVNLQLDTIKNTLHNRFRELRILHFAGTVCFYHNGEIHAYGELAEMLYDHDPAMWVIVNSHYIRTFRHDRNNISNQYVVQKFIEDLAMETA